MGQHLTAAEVKTLITPAFTVAAAKTITNVVAADNVVTVTATGHGYVTGDWIMQADIVGAVEANSLFQVTKVDANSYTLDGLTAVTEYVSGGTAKKVTVGKLIWSLKPYQLEAIYEALMCFPHVRNHDGANGSGESTLQALFP